jgi:DNA-binding NarL/FixJ family response regulator
LSNLWSKLSPREYEVAELLLLGCDQAEIAKELNLTRRTVKAYFRKMFIHAGMSGFTGIKQVKLAVMLHRDRHQSDLMPQLRQDASLLH